MLHQQSFSHHQILNKIKSFMVSNEVERRVNISIWYTRINEEFIPYMQSNSNKKSLPVSFGQGILISRSKIEDDQICNLMDARNIAATQQDIE
jgi:hypothetical protein